MNIEKQIFKKAYPDYNKLKKYGFKKEDNIYKYEKYIMNNEFKIEVIINLNNEVTSKIFDEQTNCEYKNINIDAYTGTFINKIRKTYIDTLNDIKEKCFLENLFNTKQANRITKYIVEKYGDNPEFLWDKYPEYAVFRNKKNNKWYGIIMNIDRTKIENLEGEIQIIDVKIDKKNIPLLINEKGFYQAYHMNKNNWITLILDDTLPDEEIIKYINDSYNIINKKEGTL